MKNKKKEDSVLYMYFPALGISMITLFVFAFISSLIVYSTANPTNNLEIAALATLISAAIASGIIISRFKGDGGFVVAGLSSFAVVLIMLIIGIIISGGKTAPSAFLNYGCYVGISMLSAYLGRKRGRARRRR